MAAVVKRLLIRLRRFRPTKTLLRYPAGVAIAVVLVVVVLWAPRVIAEHDIGRPKFQKLDPDKLGAEIDSVRATLLQAIAGVVLIFGARSAARQLKVAREGQVTDRYTKAIDQLGDDKSVPVRIGGIYALERIAKDSEPDRPTVVDVLAAYVRAHAPPAPIWLANPPIEPGGPPTSDVQTALTVLGRLPRSGGLDLAPLDLRGAELPFANLAGASLINTNLTGAYLGGANLAGAVLTLANLTDAYLGGANLHGATLTSTFYGASGKAPLGTIWPDAVDPIQAGALNVDTFGAAHPPAAN